MLVPEEEAPQEEDLDGDAMCQRNFHGFKFRLLTKS